VTAGGSPVGAAAMAGEGFAGSGGLEMDGSIAADLARAASRVTTGLAMAAGAGLLATSAERVAGLDA